jgi:transaldolase/glucose-6-phosphate isomerase
VTSPAAVETRELVERVWARDATLWTGRDEDRWCGWLDEPLRMRERVDEILAFVESLVSEITTFVLLGMGGSSLAPEVFRRSFGADFLHVLDTTHPAEIQRLSESIDLERTLFIASSKSGTTVETRAQLDYFWEKAGARGDRFVAVTDPRSALEEVARERGFRAVFPGEPSIGGRYSALSVFGLLPAALIGADLWRLLGRCDEMWQACRSEEGNAGLELGLQLGQGWVEGRDKVLINPNPGGFGLWVEQLLAESTGKDGKGLVPVPGETREAPDRQLADVRVTDPYELGQEFYRWEFATVVAGAIMEVNPFDQPDVQAAKDRTNAILERGGDPDLEPEGSVDELLAQADERDYVAILAFVDPATEERLEPLVARARETGCVVTVGLGPRYLHSTGQLHKGGPNTGIFIQVVDDLGEELAVPGRDFGFRRLIAAQAAGDFEALKERGRRVARIRLEEVS